MKAEEERRQLEGKLQAEALLQQMEELKLKEKEVRAWSWPHGLLSCSRLSLENGHLESCAEKVLCSGTDDSKKCSSAGFSLLTCIPSCVFSILLGCTPRC